jgi:hypothetical protein
MSTGAIIAVVIAAVIVLGLVAWYMQTHVRRRQLQQRFGPEYDRTVEDGESLRAAERELMQREKRHAQFDLKPLPPDARAQYFAEWAEIQERFVDDPGSSVNDADRLLTTVMAERGYPQEDYEQRVNDLSVNHAPLVDHYRIANDIKGRHGSGKVSTEELREAMVHYRSLFQDLLAADKDTVDGRTHGRERVHATMRRNGNDSRSADR